jgi:hypothetical protein
MTEKKYICDVCGKKFDNARALRSQVSVINGEWSKVWNEVCDACCKKVRELVDALQK